METRRATWALLALNFFMADFQAGVGPFLGVFLQEHGWQSGLIGTALTIGGVAGLLATAPAGALVDSSSDKRMLIVVAGIATCLASALVLVSQSFWMVAFSQAATALSAAVLGPAIVGITLGIVHQKGFNRQNGLNQALNHAGNVAGAALSGWLGWTYGFVAIFALAAAFGVLSIATVLLIPARDIDNAAARGLTAKDSSAAASGFSILLTCRPLLTLGIALLAFHLGNASMLPLFGMAVVGAGKGDPAGFVALTVIVAQATMVLASLIAMWAAEKTGYWTILLVSFLALPLRGYIAAHAIDSWGVYPVQILDGVGAGLQSVAVPALVARLLDGTGRINVGQGAALTAQGIGAALSPVAGGWIAQAYGYPACFLALGALSAISIVVWVADKRELDSSCAPQRSAKPT